MPTQSIVFSLVVLTAFIGCTTRIIDATSSTISCKDPDGRDVDWIYAYKLPRKFPPQNANAARRGLEFAYLTPNNLSAWQLSARTVDDPLSTIGRTMVQAFGAAPQQLVLAWNDQPPTGESDAVRGHTKGVLVADEDTAVWIVHSVPHFPDISANASTYGYPLTGHTYAQSFLCISASASELNTIAQQLRFNEPHFYNMQIPTAFADKYPQLGLIAKNNRSTISRPPFNSGASIRSRLSSTQFRSFAKAGRFDRDLYADWLAPTLDSDLMVEAWRHGADLLPSSNCTQKRQVWNVQALKVPDGKQKTFGFKTSADHSKWAVGAKAPWICVGDINRAHRQEERGGGTVCTQNKLVAQRYRELVAGFEPCAK